MKKFVILGIVFICFVSAIFVFTIIIFPRKYRAEITLSVQEFGLSESMVASIINIESGYDSEAISKAGAMGLMQLLPSTAYECASKLNISIEEEDMFVQEISIRLGCFYIRYLLDLFDNNLVNTLCAYNWGYGNVCNWIASGNVDSEGTITNIPIKETRQYIRKFKVCRFVYKNFYGYK